MQSVPITLRESVVMHDFPITENYAIFMDLSLVTDAKVCISIRSKDLHSSSQKKIRNK